jgi:hypothetical protein
MIDGLAKASAWGTEFVHALVIDGRAEIGKRNSSAFSCDPE